MNEIDHSGLAEASPESLMLFMDIELLGTDICKKHLFSFLGSKYFLALIYDKEKNSFS